MRGGIAFACHTYNELSILERNKIINNFKRYEFKITGKRGVSSLHVDVN